VTVSGTVADASGHGWPMYASIQVDDGIPGGPFYTGPKAGKYSIQLPENGTYTLHTASNYAGYTRQDVSVTTQRSGRRRQPEFGDPRAFRERVPDRVDDRAEGQPGAERRTHRDERMCVL
jgi:hypothetical protein